jgi:diguanylate cyclase (GGDEF)-like protein
MTAPALRNPSVLSAIDRLPALPAATRDVLALCRKESVEVGDLVKSISRDPALTARIMKVANSSFYARRGPISTLEDAVVLMGIKSVMMAALSISLTSQFPVTARIGDYDVEVFWKRAMIESVAARAFARRLDACNDSEAFMCALLMDLGVPLLAKCMPAEYGPLASQMDAGHPDPVAEEGAIGATHAALGALLLREWKLPDTLARAVAAHHDPDAVDDRGNPVVRDLARVLHLAHLSAGVIMSDGRAIRLRQLEDRVAAWFGKPGAFVDGVLATVERGVQEFSAAIHVDAASMTPTQMLEQARMELINVSLAAASALANAESKLAELENRAATDALTGLCNRAFFDAALGSEWSRRVAAEQAPPLGLLMVDIDHFKRFNDTWGHQTGDEALRTVARALRSAVRDSDLACRYGGEEFAVICPGAAAPTLRVIAERVRAVVASTPIRTPGGEERATVSVGTCSLASRPARIGFETLVARADEALYQAKRTGRDRVVSAPDL